MTHSENLHIVQLTLIRNLTPKEAVEWIKQHYPETSISRPYYFKLKKELNETINHKLFKIGQTVPQTVIEVRDTINDLQSKSYQILDSAIADEDYKTAQFIINLIRDLQIWRLNISEMTKSVIEVMLNPFPILPKIKTLLAYLNQSELFSI